MSWRTKLYDKSK